MTDNPQAAAAAPAAIGNAVVPQQTPEHHAGLIHDLVSAIGKVMHIAMSPAVLALLPEQDRATVIAIASLGQVVAETVDPSQVSAP